MSRNRDDRGRDQDGPPAFPGRRRYRSAARPGSRRDWQEEYLGKPAGMSWAEYMGVAPGRSRRRKDQGLDMDLGLGGLDEEGTGMGRVDPLYRSPNPHRLYRNMAEGKVGGVCAGIADYVNVESWIVRVAVVLGFFFFPPVFLIGYVVMWGSLKPRPTGLYETKEEEVFWRSVSTKPDQTLAGLRAKFRDLERELGQMEGFVASREYDLHRQFRDLERR